MIILKYNSLTEKELEHYIRMDLDDKIELSKNIIHDFQENVPNEETYISSSFGKDSIVLIDLVRQEFPKTAILYVNTGVELSSSIELSKKYDNVITVYPKKHMREIVREYGYITPLGKDKSNAIEQVRKNIHDGKFDTWRVKQMRGETDGKMWDYSNLTKHLVAPFKISAKCCYWLKISPINKFKKNTDYKYGFMGITAEESSQRRNALLNYGFNSEGYSRPIGHWTVQDILLYIIENDLELADCYGGIEFVDREYKTTLLQRTGCVCCPIAAQYDNPNKFQIIHEIDYDKWDYAINTLGFKKVLDYFGIDYL